MDWHLPGLDGVELTQRLRRQGYKGAIVAVSASVRDEDRKIMNDSGMDAFLGKPFTQAELREVISIALHLHKMKESSPKTFERNVR